MKGITVIVHDITGCDVDLKIPLNITGRELISALHNGLHHTGACPVAIRAENPFAYITGDRMLNLYDLRNGTELFFY